MVKRLCDRRMRLEVDVRIRILKWTAIDHLAPVGVGIRSSRVHSERAFIRDGAAPSDSGLGHREVLLTLRHASARAHRRQQVDDEREDVECEDQSDHCVKC